MLLILNETNSTFINWLKKKIKITGCVFYNTLGIKFKAKNGCQTQTLDVETCLLVCKKAVLPTFLKILLFIVHKEGTTVGITKDSLRLNSLTSLTSSSVNIDIIPPPDLCRKLRDIL